MESGPLTQRIFLVALMAIASFNASAGWEQVSQSAAGTIYVDPTTITKTGNRVTMWAMIDYKTIPALKEPYKSFKQHFQFDCEEMAFKVLSREGYSGQMAGGEPVMTVNEPTQWQIWMPGSVIETFWSTACKRGVQPQR